MTLEEHQKIVAKRRAVYRPYNENRYNSPIPRTQCSYCNKDWVFVEKVAGKWSRVCSLHFYKIAPVSESYEYNGEEDYYE